MKNEEKPLVTFALIAYNQEQYIDEAIKGALTQLYSPLEIILSDDCSEDATFKIMQQKASAYTGKHEVILNRNEKNQGIGGHINSVMKLACGELIVVAAGDDISLPERVSKIVDAWCASGKRAMSIHSSVHRIDQFGNAMGIRRCQYLSALENAASIAKINPPVMGSSHAWHKGVFEKFPPLGLGVIHEDRAIPFRSSMLGEVMYLDEPLVKYREGTGITASTSNIFSHEDSLYGKGLVMLERFKVDAVQKQNDALYMGRLDLVVVLDKAMKKIDLSLLFARKRSLIEIVNYTLVEKISLMVFLKQFIKYKTPAYRSVFWLRSKL
ncbi:MAG: glycosyltransferase [Halioglobus sp.]